MKMVKSLLLGSAAGLVAVGGAQAADLPVKAKPVEYVKVCSLYGAGFYYMPGTDICVKIGGFIRWQENWGAGSSISFGPFTGTGGRGTRTDSADFMQRGRAVITWDTRQQTQYGTLRTYWLLGWTQDTGSTENTVAGTGIYANRGFIQIAGFTFGKATSFFDFAATAAAAYNAGYVTSPDTGDLGWLVAAYTHQFGNGFSGTISVEQARRGGGAGSGTIDLSNSTTKYSLVGLANPAGNNLGGANMGQDLVGNLRVDQAWGSAQISAALHQISAGYYGAVGAGSEATGHPSDEIGGAVSAGFKFNTPMIGAGDYFQVQGVYAEGATRYAAFGRGGFNFDKWEGNTVGYGFLEDATYVTGGQIQRTTAWSVFASYEHHWSPGWKTSLYGSYLDVSHNAQATADICATQTAGTTSAFRGGIGTCNPDFQTAAVGTRTQWDPVKGLIVGLDLTYLYLWTARPNATNTVVLGAASGDKPAGTYFVEDKDAFAATFRIQRDVLP